MSTWLEAFKEQWLNNVFALISIVLTIMFPIVAVLFYKFKANVTKQQVILIGGHFREVVEKTSCGSPEQRATSAILLRRFFDPKTEYGVNRTPYAKDCLAVICALLKVLPTSNLQKILADNLRYAPKGFLRCADFQRTNLSKAYLGSDYERDALDFSQSDFYQANLSGASFKNAIMKGAEFYETNLSSAKFKGADLSGARFIGATLIDVDFQGADLNNADFNGSKLIGVNFEKAKNINGINFGNVTGFGNHFSFEMEAEAPIVERHNNVDGKIFISRPGIFDVRQEHVVANIRSIVHALGFETVELNRGDYEAANVLSKLKEKMESCDAIIVFGFSSLHVASGEYRLGTDDYKHVKDVFLPTPWNQIEAGMAAMIMKRMLLIHDEEVVDGIFDSSVQDSFIDRCTVAQSLNKNKSNVYRWLVSLTEENDMGPERLNKKRMALHEL